MDILKTERKATCTLVALKCHEKERTARTLAQEKWLNNYNVWYYTLSHGLIACKHNIDRKAQDAEAKVDRSTTKSKTNKKSAKKTPINKSTQPKKMEAPNFKLKPLDAAKWCLEHPRTILFFGDWWAVTGDKSLLSYLSVACGEYGIAKKMRSMFVTVGPTVHSDESIHKAIANDVIRLEVALPDNQGIRDAIEKVLSLDEIKKSKSFKKPEDGDVDLIASECAGLTRYQVENTAYRCLVDTKTLDVQFFRNETQKIANALPGVRVVHPKFSVDDIGGMRAAIDYMNVITNPDLPKELAPKMLIFVGVSGTGKSMAAYAFASIRKWRAIDLHLGNIQGRYVGESEEKWAKVQDFLGAVDNAVIVLDELEKQAAGMGTDSSGTMTRMMGSFLTWNQNRDNRALIVATANSIMELNTKFPELFRPGRVDKIFFVDVPNQSQREDIIRLKSNKYDIAEDAWPTLHGWTGAEIEQLALEFARYRAAGEPRSLKELSDGIIPITQKNSMLIKELRDFANHQFVDANTGKPYVDPDNPDEYYEEISDSGVEIEDALDYDEEGTNPLAPPAPPAPPTVPMPPPPPTNPM